MQILTLGNLKSRISDVLGTCDTDSRVTDVINEAQQRLIYKGDWQGVYRRYRVCTNESCLVWPRQIDQIEAMAICKEPGVVRNEWFEFIGTGPWLQDDDDNIGKQLIDRGSTVAFDWVRGTDKFIRVYANSANDAGKTITLRYYDDSAQKVFTSIGGTWQEGEQITLVAPPSYAVTANKVMANGLYGVVKDVTTDYVFLYEYDGTSNTRTLAQYEPDETHPIYRMTMIPGLSQFETCEGATDDCSNRWVTVMARLRHVPVRVDNDPLVLNNASAIKLMAQAIKEEDSRNYNFANQLEIKALRELEFELAAHLGQGPVVAIRHEDPRLFGAGAIDNYVDY